MLRDKKYLTLAELKHQWDYNPETGTFTKLVDGPRTKTGFVAGSQDSDVRRIRVYISGFGNMKAHRVAWFYMTGTWPPNQIDHIDCNFRNNKFGNLRLATNSQNHCNKLSAKNTSGYKGVVSIPTGKWGAQIKKNGKHRWLGTFDTKELAAAAYAKAAKNLHGKFARLV